MQCLGTRAWEKRHTDFAEQFPNLPHEFGPRLNDEFEVGLLHKRAQPCDPNNPPEACGTHQTRWKTASRRVPRTAVTTSGALVCVAEVGDLCPVLPCSDPFATTFTTLTSRSGLNVRCSLGIVNSNAGSLRAAVQSHTFLRCSAWASSNALILPSTKEVASIVRLSSASFCCISCSIVLIWS